MATTKPRITITISHRQHEILQAMSAATGQSMSSHVTELLDTAEPVLERIAATMTKVRQLSIQRKASVAAALDDAQTAIDPLMNAVIGQFDLFAGRLENALGGPAESDSDSGATAGPTVAVPRPVITGDKPPAKRAKKVVAKPAQSKSQSGTRRVRA